MEETSTKPMSANKRISDGKVHVKSGVIDLPKEGNSWLILSPPIILAAEGITLGSMPESSSLHIGIDTCT